MEKYMEIWKKSNMENKIYLTIFQGFKSFEYKANTST